MSDPAYDGLCGMPSTARLTGGGYLRCQHEFGHGGEHSWVGRENKIRVGGVCNAADPRWLDRPLEAK